MAGRCTVNTLRHAVQEYLDLRRNLGFKLQQTGRGLFDFVTYMEQPHATHITQALALAWAQQPKKVQPSHWARRLSFVRGFAHYRSASDARTQVPLPGLLPFQPKRARPYLYSDDEIKRLLRATLKLPCRYKRNVLQPWVYYCLFGLLSVSGLRVSEALNLELQDVDLKAAVLTIRGENGHDQRPHLCCVVGAFLHTAFDAAAPDKPAHRQFLSGHISPISAICQAAVTSAAVTPEIRADRRAFDHGISGRFGAAPQYLLNKHRKTACQVCPSLKDKRVTVHRLRHTAAMDLLQAGVDRAVIALWLGHESVETTQIYLEATLAMKEQALSKATPLQSKSERYQPGDQLLAFLNNL